MYKNRVENDRKNFEIPTLLFCKRGNSVENGVGKFKMVCYFEFGCPHSQDKRAGISKKNFVIFTLVFLLLFLYIPCPKLYVSQLLEHCKIVQYSNFWKNKVAQQKLQINKSPGQLCRCASHLHKVGNFFSVTIQIFFS